MKPHMWQLNREWKIKREKPRQEIIENKKQKESFVTNLNGASKENFSQSFKALKTTVSNELLM